jgi:hypothetical protein
MDGTFLDRDPLNFLTRREREARVADAKAKADRAVQKSQAACAEALRLLGVYQREAAALALLNGHAQGEFRQAVELALASAADPCIH